MSSASKGTETMNLTTATSDYVAEVSADGDADFPSPPAGSSAPGWSRSRRSLKSDDKVQMWTEVTVSSQDIRGINTRNGVCGGSRQKVEDPSTCGKPLPKAPDGERPAVNHCRLTTTSQRPSDRQSASTEGVICENSPEQVPDSPNAEGEEGGSVTDGGREGDDALAEATNAGSVGKRSHTRSAIEDAPHLHASRRGHSLASRCTMAVPADPDTSDDMASTTPEGSVSTSIAVQHLPMPEKMPRNVRKDDDSEEGGGNGSDEVRKDSGFNGAWKTNQRGPPEQRGPVSRILKELGASDGFKGPTLDPTALAKRVGRGGKSGLGSSRSSSARVGGRSLRSHVPLCVRQLMPSKGYVSAAGVDVGGGASLRGTAGRRRRQLALRSDVRGGPNAVARKNKPNQKRRRSSLREPKYNGEILIGDLYQAVVPPVKVMRSRRETSGTSNTMTDDEARLAGTCVWSPRRCDGYLKMCYASLEREKKNAAVGDSMRLSWPTDEDFLTLLSSQNYRVHAALANLHTVGLPPALIGNHYAYSSSGYGSSEASTGPIASPKRESNRECAGGQSGEDMSSHAQTDASPQSSPSSVQLYRLVDTSPSASPLALRGLRCGGWASHAASKWSLLGNVAEDKLSGFLHGFPFRLGLRNDLSEQLAKQEINGHSFADRSSQGERVVKGSLHPTNRSKTWWVYTCRSCTTRDCSFVMRVSGVDAVEMPADGGQSGITNVLLDSNEDDARWGSNSKVVAMPSSPRAFYMESPCKPKPRPRSVRLVTSRRFDYQGCHAPAVHVDLASKMLEHACHFVTTATRQGAERRSPY